MKTIGLSPKAVVAVVMAVLAYLLTQQLVDFPAWVDLAITAGLVGGGAAGASPGTVVRK